MPEKKSLVDLYRANWKPFWAEDDSGFRFYVVAIAPNRIAIGWSTNGQDYSFGGLSQEWFKCDEAPEMKC